MFQLAQRYAHWLHTGFPSGAVEPLPEVAADGSTNVPGLLIAGDLGGIPLLKFAADSGARQVQAMVADPAFQRERAEIRPDVLDLAIVGAGVAGLSAALEAQAAGLRFVVLEASEPLSTLVNFPVGKPIFAFPTELTPAGALRFEGKTRESLLEELRRQARPESLPIRLASVEGIARSRGLLELQLKEGRGDMATLLARRVIVAIGRSGNFRRLQIPGESLEKVFNRLHDPAEFRGRSVLVVGGGDSALEAAIALEAAGARVTLAHRGASFTRPRDENRAAVAELEQKGRLRVLLETRPVRIEPARVHLQTGQAGVLELENDVVFSLIGREAPLAFLRRCGVRIQGELQASDKLWLGLFLALCTFVYNWKAGGVLKHAFETRGWFPFNMPGLLSSLGDSIAQQVSNPSTLLGTLSITLTEPGFYYSILYSVCVTVFGIQRIRRRNTPYVRRQTLTLMAVQLLPLFFLPYVLLPWLGHNGLFDSGLLKTVGDSLFPEAGYGHGREYWRAFGLILAWPLFIWNLFTAEPLWGWLLISFVQTFVIIPYIVYRWGKGAYCGWICSCGALAETLGDTYRTRMPHGRFWNRLNLAGQVILWTAFLLFFARALSWTFPNTWLGGKAAWLFNGLLSGWQLFGIQLNYYWIVDVTLAGIVGVGLYFWFSGRVWCRFFCPLAALMHIYSRFSRFRILSEKKKCISCNVCTSVCHQGIDVMAFASRGMPMNDPQCVRCSACVSSCPTGVLSFGEVDPSTGAVIRVDSLVASPVHAREGAAYTRGFSV